MIGAVFDTNVFLQAAVSEGGPSHACWKLAEDRKIRVFVTKSILAEIEDVFTRPKVKRQFEGLSDQHVANMLRAFQNSCSHVDEPKPEFQLARDDNDAKFVDLAIVTGAEYIVTRDRDLLDLMQNTEFTSRVPLLRIANPVDFLKVVRAV